MATSIAQHGTATISSTATGPGSKPYVAVTSTGVFTATHFVQVTPRNTVEDTRGTIVISASRYSDDVLYVYASRQLPAGKSIGFDWVSTTGAP